MDTGERHHRHTSVQVIAPLARKIAEEDALPFGATEQLR
jgi:hypothetical protein